MNRKKEEKPFTYIIKNEESIDAADLKDQTMLTQDERLILSDLEIEHKKEMNELESFLNLQYIRLDHKKNVCMYKRCFDNIYKSRLEINQCIGMCNSGIPEINKYIDKLMIELQDQTKNCFTNAQTESYQNMKESLKCYESLIQNIKNIKILTTEELKFYKA